MGSEFSSLPGGRAGSIESSAAQAGTSWASADLGALDDLVTRVRRRPSGEVSELALQAELETAHEELRVADDEIRVQRRQVDELLDAQRTSWARRRHLNSMLPVPMLSTDSSGRIDQANPAAAARLNVPLVRLAGKPVIAFVHDADRAVVRSAISRAGEEPVRLSVLLTPRRSEPVAVELVLVAQLLEDGATALEWTFLDGGPEHRSRVDPLRLAAAIAEMSRLPLVRTDVQPLLADLTRTARTALPDGASMSINLGHPGRPTHVASTSEDASFGDGLQVRADEGPCVDAYDEQEVVLTDQVAADPRWPRLRAIWAGDAVTAVLAVPVFAGGRLVGVLNCYSPVVAAFGEAEANAIEVLAFAAGAALETVEEAQSLREVAAQLEQALDSRAVIDQAIGIVIARRGCTAEEAFGHLAALSQARNVKVRALARALVEQSGASASGVTRRHS